MTPISQFIAIKPMPESNKLASGLFSVEKVSPVSKATVTKISEDIKDLPLNIGDTIAYLSGRGKWFGGECFINLEMVLAKL